MAELDKSDTNWLLEIVGSDQDNMLHQYREFVEQHRLQERIKFCGNVSDTRGILENSDVFVLTSITEALPLAVIEAIAMGVPCIVTDVGGNSDIIEDGREGFLVQPKDCATIVKHIRFLMKNPDVRMEMSLAARRKAVEEFDFNHMLDRYCRLFQHILGR
jgi:glycosyltransferase involved in cell wall biosynthesis